MVKQTETEVLQAEVIGLLADIDQRVLIAPEVIIYLRRRRQLTARAHEAGGQLFGTIDAAQVCVNVATGPYRGDERSRYRYRSDLKAAQRTINEQAKNGLLYLGEWHTHAEDRPDPSSLDDEAMRLLLKRSKLNSNSLLMMIVGRDPTVEGLRLWSISPDLSVQWQLAFAKR
ncbi:MAG: Mov34/MPN/PAD-1 family protein [Candidimonas sp.]|nr:Mov34/MPN/PAD-1 family protein [Candidimonas sp.]